MRSRYTTAVRAAARAAFLVLTLLLLSFAAAPAQAACADRDEIVSALESRYGERPAAVGIIDQVTIVEVFAAPGGVTWTILLTRPDGVSCAILAGEAWRRTALRPPKRASRRRVLNPAGDDT